MEPRAYLSGAAGTPPPLLPTAVLGYPCEATLTTPATIVGPRWVFMVGEEARNLMIAGNVAPSVSDNTCMLRAVLAIGAAA